jgi:hypothetical protein
MHDHAERGKLQPQVLDQKGHECILNMFGSDLCALELIRRRHI